MNCEAVHYADSHTVSFAIYPDGLDGPRIIARISEKALLEMFEARSCESEQLLKACQAHFDLIEAMALERYRAMSSQPVVLQTEDFVIPLDLLRRHPAELEHRAGIVPAGTNHSARMSFALTTSPSSL
jgi:hypothetical protein